MKFVEFPRQFDLSITLHRTGEDWPLMKLNWKLYFDWTNERSQSWSTHKFKKTCWSKHFHIDVFRRRVGEEEKEQKEVKMFEDYVDKDILFW